MIHSLFSNIPFRQAGQKKIQQVPPAIQAYWTFRDEVTIKDELVLKNSSIIIPTLERNDLLRQIHHGHLGTIKCQLCAKETIYWPGINKAIEDMVQNCETCLKFSANNCKPKPSNTLGHEVPVIPWAELAMDVVEVDFLWNRTVDSLKTSFHPLLWTSSGLRDS